MKAWPLVDRYAALCLSLVIGCSSPEGAPSGNGATDQPGKGGSSQSGDDAASAPSDDRIVYVRSVVGVPGAAYPIGNISTARPDGTDEHQLTDVGKDSYPAWSRDGKRIAFGRENQVWTMNADGSNQKQLTTENGIFPSWSPDGTIAFNRATPTTTDGNPDTWVMRDDGSEQRQIQVGAFAPNFSPDGTKIVYKGEVKYPDRTRREIFVMNPDGSNAKQLTFPTDPDHPDANAPVWSPDGNYIAFFCGHDALDQTENFGDRAPSTQQVCVMDSDGSNRRQVTRCDFCASDNPNWSADGRQLIFDRGSLREMSVTTYVVNVDGTGERQFLPFPYGAGRLTFKPR